MKKYKNRKKRKFEIFRINKEGIERPPQLIILTVIMYNDQGVPTPTDKFKLQITENK